MTFVAAIIMGTPPAMSAIARTAPAVLIVIEIVTAGAATAPSARTRTTGIA
jgi:hypothetical protein